MTLLLDEVSRPEGEATRSFVMLLPSPTEARQILTATSANYRPYLTDYSVSPSTSCLMFCMKLLHVKDISADIPVPINTQRLSYTIRVFPDLDGSQKTLKAHLFRKEALPLNRLS